MKRVMRSKINKGLEEYTSDDGWVLRREYGQTPNGNPLGGRWVLRNEQGEMVGFDQYRHDIAEKFDLDLRWN